MVKIHYYDQAKKTLTILKRLIRDLPPNIWTDIRGGGQVQLTIIYEKDEKLQEAIDVCNFAIKHGLMDGTKGGFEGRIKKLEKKENRK